jgi:hypothetical protein
MKASTPWICLTLLVSRHNGLSHFYLLACVDTHRHSRLVSVYSQRNSFSYCISWTVDSQFEFDLKRLACKTVIPDWLLSLVRVSSTPGPIIRYGRNWKDAQTP